MKTITLALPLTLVSLASSLQDVTDDLARLLEGVETVARPGVPGPLVAFGEDTFPVVLGTTGRGLRLPVVVAARHGRGRVVAFGHDGYFADGALATGQTARLVENALQWAAGEGEGPLRVGHRGVPWLARLAGSTAVALSGADWTQRLDRVDVVCTFGSDLGTDEDIEALRKWIAEGGALLIADLGWGWQQLHPRLDLARDHPGNRLLAPIGIVWASGTFDRVAPMTRPEDLELTQASLALDRLQRQTEAPLEDREVRQTGTLLAHALRSIPPGDWPFSERVEEAISGRPRAGRFPIQGGDVLDRLAVVRRHVEDARRAPRDVEPAPSAEVFPGPVPKRAPRKTQTLELDLGRGGWLSTGLYAPPGEVIVVEIPEESTERGLFVRIGAHSDVLWDHPTWNRHPEVCRREPLLEARTELASPFGGPIYVESPGGGSPATISIAGAVEAPCFVRGVTSRDEWKRTIRSHPAPWGELETTKVILTLPSDVLRQIDDPGPVLALWDRVLDCYEELGRRPLGRRPQRFVTDLQISAGYMHSGYPIMTHLDVASVMVDREVLVERRHGGVWGLWHELGHNHQQPDWTFEGTGEVTCNLFTLYVIEELSGTPPAKTKEMQGLRSRVASYLEAPDFGTWKREPFLALAMYVEVQAAFGWEPFQEVFAEYRDLPPEERPRNDPEKRDQWLIRLSRAVGHDLSPFFEAWAIPTSESAREQLEELPPWIGR